MSYVDHKSLLEEDEQLARAIQESLNVESPPRYGNGNGNMYPPRYVNGNGNMYQPMPVYFPMGSRYESLFLGTCYATAYSLE